MTWQAAGCRVHAVDLPDERVTFHRGLREAAPRGVPAELRAAATVARHIFVSYSHVDGTYVDGLKKHLASSGLDVWTDEGIDYGAQWSAVIEQQIVTCAIFVPVMTPRARHAPWVNREIDLAQEICAPILPLLEGRPLLASRDLQARRCHRGTHAERPIRRSSTRPNRNFAAHNGQNQAGTPIPRRISYEAYRLALG